MKNEKAINLYLLSLYFISNFLLGLSILFSATTIQELCTGWGILTLANLVIIMILYSATLDEEKKEKEKE